MPRIAPLLLMLMVAIPAGIATPVFADSRDRFRADDFRADSPGYDDRDDDDGPSDLYGRHGDFDDDDDDDYGAYGPDDDEFEPDDSSDGMRT